MTVGAETKKKVTWRDFPLEEHMEAHLGSVPGCRISVKKISDKLYRANFYSPESATIVKSCVVKCIESPEGYCFETIDTND
jgi:hypothetical protein